jgi:hypothetical protein
MQLLCNKKRPATALSCATLILPLKAWKNILSPTAFLLFLIKDGSFSILLIPKNGMRCYIIGFKPVELTLFI